MNRVFKAGDQVITFDWVQKNKWTPAKMVTDTATVVDVCNGKVIVDGLFGEVEYDPDDLEFADVPF